MGLCDSYAICIITGRRRRRIAMPMPPKPRSIIIQVAGSGTGGGGFVARLIEFCLNRKMLPPVPAPVPVWLQLDALALRQVLTRIVVSTSPAVAVIWESLSVLAAC